MTRLERGAHATLRRPGKDRDAAGVEGTVIRALPRLHIAPDPATAPLIERAVELEVLSAAVRRLACGGSGVVLLEAPAGLGKTALLEHAATLATRAGCLVRRAVPGPLERH